MYTLSNTDVIIWPGRAEKPRRFGMKYLPYEAREPDGQYRELLYSILTKGERVPSRQGPVAITLFGAPQMRFKLENGFPCITNRNIEGFWKGAIGELCAFINGATTLAEFEEFGCSWWGPWATEEKCSKRGLSAGDLGPGSYGGSFHDWPDRNGASYNQFEHLVCQIAESPGDRTHIVSPWNGALLARDSGRINKATIAPCHGWLQVRIMNNKIHLHHMQRSGDVPIGVPSNMVQYAALLLMLEQITGYQAGDYIHYIVDAHIYEDQADAAWQMVNRSDMSLPRVEITEQGKLIKNIHDFRSEHFELHEYYPHQAMKGIPVAI